jgi:hypothetical protein
MTYELMVYPMAGGIISLIVCIFERSLFCAKALAAEPTASE